MGRIDVRVLGTPQVAIDGADLALAGRPLLVAVRLGLAHPVPVSSHRLLDDIWGGSSGADGAVRVSLTRLRAALGPDGVRRLPSGYTLSTPTFVDATRFRDLVRLGRDDARGPEVRLAAVTEALGLWRGRAFDGLEQLDWLESEAVSLDELREHAIDEQLTLRLALGESASVVGDLRAALAQDPTRERRAEMLALAMYRAGRQSEALTVIAATARMLRERLGLDPGDGLRELEVRILRHDAQLLHEAPSTERESAAAEARLRSAEVLVRVEAFDEALPILQETVAELRSTTDRRLLAHALLANAEAVVRAASGDPHPLIDEAQRIGRELRDGELLARCAITRFGSGISSDKHAALIELTEPLALLPSSAPEQIDLLCAAAVLVIFSDASDGADRLLMAAEQLHRAAPTPRSEATWLITTSIVGSVRGEALDEIDRRSARAYEIARQTDDPTLIVVAIQARLRLLYTLGDLDGVEELLPVLEPAATRAALSFGSIRVLLCKAMNAIARGELDAAAAVIEQTRGLGRTLRTVSTEGATRGQEVLLMLERDDLPSLGAVLRPMVEHAGPGPWHALLALCGLADDLPPLLQTASAAPADDTFPAVVAFCAEVAGRTGDADLASWSLGRLDEYEDRTVTVGLGTLVLGHTAYFAGVARRATGELDASIASLRSAVALAEHSGAGLWRSSAGIELAISLRRRGSDADLVEAHAALADPSLTGLAERVPRLRRRLEEVVMPGG